MTTAAPPRTSNGDAVDVGDLELAAPFDAAITTLGDREPSAAAARFLVRLHGEPVGRLDVPASSRTPDRFDATVRRALRGDLAVSVASALARRAVAFPARSRDAIAELWERGAPRVQPTSLPLTVAICTRDRPEGVRRVLASLGASLDDDVDVLVVDNAPSTPETRNVVARVSGARYVRERMPGLDRARNRALREARGTVVAFADDDVVVDPQWCGVIRRRFDENPELTLLTGLVEPHALATQAEQWFEAYGGFGRGYRPRWVHAPGASRHPIAFPLANTGRFGTGANLAVRRDAALHLGGFDPSLDVGTATRGGGDLEMMFRVLKGEGVVGYAPDAVIRHAHRRTWDELASQIESWGSGMVAHLTRTARAHREERAAVAALRAWLYGTWFAKRLATSYLYEPFPRELIRRELLGSRRGAALYGEASTALPAPPRTPPLPGRGTRRTRIVEYDLTLGGVLAPLEVRDASIVRFRVRTPGVALGSVEVRAIGGIIGATRLRDAIAERWRADLLGTELAGAARRMESLLWKEQIR